MSDHEALLRRAYEAFNARDIEGALALMHEDVDWPNGIEGGREHGHAAVRAYWKRQFLLVSSNVEPRSFATNEQGRMVVRVHQVVHNLCGELVSDREVIHAYSIRDDLIERMDIVEAA
jgi:hypothetical protein